MRSSVAAPTPSDPDECFVAFAIARHTSDRTIPFLESARAVWALVNECCWAKAQAGPTALGGVRCRKASARPVERPVAEAGVRELIRDALVAESRTQTRRAEFDDLPMQSRSTSTELRLRSYTRRLARATIEMSPLQSSGAQRPREWKRSSRWPAPRYRFPRDAIAADDTPSRDPSRGERVARRPERDSGKQSAVEGRGSAFVLTGRARVIKSGTWSL